MARIVYLAADGTAYPVDADEGVSLMEAAVQNGVPGIDGDCGGNAACATCHIYVPDDWRALTGERSEMEAAMLEFADGVEAGSRLGCQIAAGPALDGLTIRMPAAQH